MAVGDGMVVSLDTKYFEIDRINLETATFSSATALAENRYENEITAKTRPSISGREDAWRRGCKTDKIKSKLLRKGVRAILRAYWRDRIGRILSEFKGTKHTDVQSNVKRSMLTSVVVWMQKATCRRVDKELWTLSQPSKRYWIVTKVTNVKIKLN